MIDLMGQSRCRQHSSVIIFKKWVSSPIVVWIKLATPKVAFHLLAHSFASSKTNTSLRFLPVEIRLQINTIYKSTGVFLLSSALSGIKGVRTTFGSMAEKPQSQNYVFYTHFLT